MHSFIVFLTVVITAAHAGHYYNHPAALLHGDAEVLEGPSSSTTVVGPEGSVITAVAPGGKIVHEQHVGGISIGHTEALVAGAPLVSHGHSALVSHAGYFSHAAPIVAHSAPYVAHAAPVLAHSAPYVAHAAPVLAHSAPYVTHAGPVLAHPAPYVTHSAAVVTPGAWGHSSLVHPVDGDAVLTGPSGVVTRTGAIHGVAHAAPHVVSHYDGVVPQVVSDVAPHATHELAFEDIQAW